MAPLNSTPRWTAPGFFPGDKKYRGQLLVVYDALPGTCPKCGANCNIEEHNIFYIEGDKCAERVSSECQLGCGHSVFMM